MSLTEYLVQQQVEFEFLPHPPAFSAARLANYLGLPGAQVAKTVLLRGPSSFLLAVLPSTHRLETESLARSVGGPVRLATTQEMAEVFRDCELGMVPPFGRLYGLATLLDDSFAADSLLVFEGQTCVEAIRMRCRDYERLECPRRLAFAQPGGPDVRHGQAQIEASQLVPSAVPS